MRVVSLGDLVLDVVVRLRQPLALGADATSDITVTTGGQAANVAAWVAALGGSARWLGKRADDDAGRLAATRLERLGVELTGPVLPGGSGVIVSLVAPDGERSMCPDRGVATLLEPGELEPAWLACDHLHVSGYALVTEPVRSAAIHAVELARGSGAQVSVDLSSWSAVRDVGPERFRDLVAGLQPDVVFANEEEVSIVGGSWSGPTWIVKRGAAGCVFGGEERHARPVAEVVDTTGAGDALAAGWILGGPERALEAAARCVGTVGSMP
jgi:sugar/nucleoside kinase (ribokinase family)